MLFNVYCDESCHLERDQFKCMVLGGVWCPTDKVREITQRVEDIKIKHGVKKDCELKWTKLSPSKQNLFLDVLDYFYDDADLHFRGLVVPNKNILNHELFSQTHDTWYYKMYFEMLKIIIDPSCKYNIYLDIKDTKGAEKIQKLREILSNNIYDFSQRSIRKIQLIRSHESSLLQMSDLLIGSLSHIHRNLDSSSAKIAFIQRFRERSGYKLTENTLPSEKKTNILIWRPREDVCQ